MSAEVVAVIIVNHNGGERLLACVASVLAQDHAPFCPILIDNASTDRSPDRIARRFPGLLQRRLPENRGYAAACNVGIGQAGDAEYLLFLAGDMQLPPDALSRFLSAARRHPHVGLWNPVVTFPDGRFDFAGVKRGWLPGRSPHRRTPPPAVIFEIPRCYGGVLFARRRIFQEIGGWDERFFLYFEDVDLSWRARDAGFAIACTGEIRVVHASGYDPKDLPPHIVYHHTRNWLRLLAKHGRLSGAGRLWIVVLACWSILSRFRHFRDWVGWRASLRALYDFLRTNDRRFPC